MLIGSENTCICVLVILYEVLIRGNHAGGGKVLLKKSCHEITPPQFAAGYAAAQLSIDKRMSCTASDSALSILRAHYEMQINILFTLSRETRSPTGITSKRAHTFVWALLLVVPTGLEPVTL